MGSTTKTKSLTSGNIDIQKDIDLINEHTVQPLKAEDVYVFPVEICDNEVDRVGDKMSDEFLQEVADNISGLTGLKDHDWSSDNQMARLYSAELVEDENKKNLLGENRKYVLGKAYTLSKYKDYIEKINAGLLKESSLSFKSSGDRCSICGCEMVKDANDIGHCENGHIAGETYDGELCYNDINSLDDLMEWSLVAVPCQKGAGIKNKNIGGTSVMKKAELLIKQLIHSKDLDHEVKEQLEEAVEVADQVLSEDEIKKIVEENISLKEEVKGLKSKMKELEAGHQREKIEDIVSKGLDELKPLTPKVKEMMLKEIPLDDLKLEDGQIPGLEDVFEGIKKSYEGLFTPEISNESGETEDIANKSLDEAEVQAKEEEDTSKEEEKEAEAEEVEEKGCGDGDIEKKEAPASNVTNKGLHFSNTRVGVGSNNKSVAVNKVRNGIVFN